MEILAVRHAIPSLKMSNSDVIEHVKTLMTGSPEIDEYTARIADFLKRSGADTRYWLAKNEKASDLLRAAVEAALNSASLPADEIDLIIFAGVSRGWLEPSMACYVQNMIGANRATCFDVLEACASWVRAMQIAYHFLRQGTYRIALIVNCECGIRDYEEIHTNDPGKDQLGGFTLGEAATATLLSSDQLNDFSFVIKSYGQHYNLCMLPTISAHRFIDEPPKSNRFYAKSEALFISTISHMAACYTSSPELYTKRYDFGFFHAASGKAIGIVHRQFNIRPEIVYSTYERFGNTGAASIPLAISCALQEGALRKGQKILVGAGSAGISVGFISFTY